MNNKPRIWLLEFEAYNKTNESIETFRYSSHGIKPFLPTDPDRPNVWFEARIKDPANFERYLFSKGSISGSSTINSGEISLINVDGGLDFLFDYGVDGRNLSLLVGYEGQAFAEFEPVLNGTMKEPEFIWSKRNSLVSLKVQDLQAKIQSLKIQDNRYLGTNSGATGVEGTADDIKDNVKPLCYGKCLNLTAIAVNTTLNIYQVHDGSIEDVVNVYDNGVALIDDGDVADLATLQAASISGGHFKTCLALGLFRVGGTPAGKITADVKGTNNTSYAYTVADIIYKVLTEQAGVSSSDINTTDFTTLNTANSAVVGIYIKSETTIGSVLDDLTNSIGAFWTTTDEGKFTVGLLNEPATTPVATWQKEDIVEIERLSWSLPAYELKINYAKNYTVQNADTLASSVTTSRVAFLEKEFRAETVKNSAVLTAHPLAETAERNTLLKSLSDVETEASRLLSLFSVPRQILRVVVPFDDAVAVRQLNSTHQIKLARYGMSSGKNFVLTGIIPNEPSNNLMTLELWG